VGGKAIIKVSQPREKHLFLFHLVNVCEDCSPKSKSLTVVAAVQFGSDLWNV